MLATRRSDKPRAGHLLNRKVKNLTILPFAFPVRNHQASSFKLTVNITASHPRVNKTSTDFHRTVLHTRVNKTSTDFHRTVLHRTATFDAHNGSVAPMSDRRTCALIEVKENTGANTARTPDTETKVKDGIRQGLQKIFSQVIKNSVDLFESLPNVLANSREINTNKLCMNYFMKWQKWENRFSEVNATPAEEI